MNGNKVGYDNWKLNNNAGCCNSGFDLFQGMCFWWFKSVYYTVNVRNKHILIVPLQGSVISNESEGQWGMQSGKGVFWIYVYSTSIEFKLSWYLLTSNLN